MPTLASYCFKPKHGPEIAEKIIERFVNKFLSDDHEGFYLHWRRHDPRVRQLGRHRLASGTGKQPLPQPA